eukprot:scaffold24260_cov126-Isochrysis_galbana.AAC.10
MEIIIIIGTLIFLVHLSQSSHVPPPRRVPQLPLALVPRCWQNAEKTPPNQPIVMPVHPPHIPLAPMYPPEFDVPTPAPQPPPM